MTLFIQSLKIKKMAWITKLFDIEQLRFYISTHIEC